MTMRESVTGKTYDVWAWFYDHTFGALVKKRQSRAVQQLRARPGDRVLDIGVGTGMLLPLYPRDVMIVGVDLSSGMLAKAALKCRQHGLDHCRLIRADAMLLPFAEASFDQIVITHAISVVSDPHKLIHWATKLVKPDGRIILLNHFMSAHRVVAWFEKILNPMFMKIGWRSDLAAEDVLSDPAGGAALQVEYRFKIGLVDLWQIIVLTPRRPGVDERSTAVTSPQEETRPITMAPPRLAVADAG
jgi:phosphatidylethanolamine/phosphatidyl-N-methylethanolamine N-methyltransferase